MNNKNAGLIGVGKMGYRIALRMRKFGFLLFLFDQNPVNINILIDDGAIGCRSLQELVSSLSQPKVILFCVPAGKVIDELLLTLAPYLENGDTIIDLGNSFIKTVREGPVLLKKRGFFLLMSVSVGEFLEQNKAPA